MDWLAGEKTKVVGTYPPRKRGWTGYVEKDTAGQKNIYSVEVCLLHLNPYQIPFEFFAASMEEKNNNNNNSNQ